MRVLFMPWERVCCGRPSSYGRAYTYTRRGEIKSADVYDYHKALLSPSLSGDAILKPAKYRASRETERLFISPPPPFGAFVSAHRRGDGAQPFVFLRGARCFPFLLLLRLRQTLCSPFPSLPLCSLSLSFSLFPFFATTASA